MQTSVDDLDQTSRTEFLRKTISDRTFMMNNTKIVSASPYRAIIRRQNHQMTNQQTSRDNSDEEDEMEGEANDDFERDHDPLDMGANSTNYPITNPNL